MVKPRVHYRDISDPPVVGGRALLKTIDHPSSRVTNVTNWVSTSIITHVFDNGEFETLYSYYVPEELDAGKK